MVKLLVLADWHVGHYPFSVNQKGKRLDDGADAGVLAGHIHKGLRGCRWAREIVPSQRLICSTPDVCVACTESLAIGRSSVSHLNDLDFRSLP